MLSERTEGKSSGEVGDGAPEAPPTQSVLEPPP